MVGDVLVAALDQLHEAGECLDIQFVHVVQDSALRHRDH